MCWVKSWYLVNCSPIPNPGVVQVEKVFSWQRRHLAQTTTMVTKDNTQVPIILKCTHHLGLVEVKDLFGRCGRDDTGILLSSSQRGFQAPYSLSQLQRPWKYTYNIWFKDILDHFCNICMSGNGRLNGLLVAFFICKIHILFNLSPVSQLFFEQILFFIVAQIRVGSWQLDRHFTFVQSRTHKLGK